MLYAAKKVAEILPLELARKPTDIYMVFRCWLQRNSGSTLLRKLPKIYGKIRERRTGDSPMKPYTN